jgi:hypothetical protein
MLCAGQQVRPSACVVVRGRVSHTEEQRCYRCEKLKGLDAFTLRIDERHYNRYLLSPCAGGKPIVGMLVGEEEF